MAARRPFWKWRRWKSIGFCLWPPSTCIWNLKLKFQSKLDLCSGNQVVYRQLYHTHLIQHQPSSATHSSSSTKPALPHTPHPAPTQFYHTTLIQHLTSSTTHPSPSTTTQPSSNTNPALPHTSQHLPNSLPLRSPHAATFLISNTLQQKSSSLPSHPYPFQQPYSFPPSHPFQHIPFTLPKTHISSSVSSNTYHSPSLEPTSLPPSLSSSTYHSPSLEPTSLPPSLPPSHPAHIIHLP